LSLQAGSVPLIAIQITAIQVEGRISLVPVKVLDARALLREDSEIATTAKAGRALWTENHGNTLQVVDSCLALINETGDKKFDLKLYAVVPGPFRWKSSTGIYYFLATQYWFEC
jgi:hypothetical protein